MKSLIIEQYHFIKISLLQVPQRNPLFSEKFQFFHMRFLNMLKGETTKTFPFFDIRKNMNSKFIP